MKRTAVFALMIALSLLTACGGGAEREAFEKFSGKLAAAESLSFTANVTAQYDDRSCEFTLDYAQSSEQGAAVTVKAPDMIAGITARIAPGSSELEYDGRILDTGDLTPSGLTPVSSLPKLAETLKSGHVDTVWKEGDATVAQLTPENGLTVTVWLDENMTPYHAELQNSGKVVVFCDIINFKYS